MIAVRPGLVRYISCELAGRGELVVTTPRTEQAWRPRKFTGNPYTVTRTARNPRLWARKSVQAYASLKSDLGTWVNPSRPGHICIALGEHYTPLNASVAFVE